jgi:hypothetical protein
MDCPEAIVISVARFDVSEFDTCIARVKLHSRVARLGGTVNALK